MNKYLVSIDGALVSECLVQPRTRKLVPGVLCEVGVNGRFELCLIDRVGPTTLTVRRLPKLAEERKSSADASTLPLRGLLAPLG